MFWETLFFISGSLFFIISILILLTAVFYLWKIVAASLAVEKEIKNLADELKNKINSLAITFTGITTLLEKLISFKKDLCQNKHNENKIEQNNDGIQKKPRKIKIASLDNDQSNDQFEP